MRRFIIGVIFLVLSVWLGLKIAADPGLALFLYRDWSMEMPLWFAIVSLLVLLGVFYFFIRIFDGVDQSFYRWKNWLKWRRKHKSYSKTNRGLIELIEGNWKSAENYLLEGIDRSDMPLINYLAAAKAAHEQKAYEKRDMYLRQAHDLAPQADVAIGLTQAQLQLDQGQLEQALATLNHLRNIAPRHAVVLKLLKKIYIHLADWKNLLKLLPNLRKLKIVTQEQMDKLEQHTYEELLSSTANKAESVEAIHEIWRTVPKKLQMNPRLIFCYAKQLLRYPDMIGEVEELINKTLKKSWDKDLVLLYGVLVTPNPKKQLVHAESWVKPHPNQAVLSLTLGRLSNRCQLWGKAREYFEESAKLEARAETYFELAELLEQIGELELAKQSLKQGLKLVRG